MAKIPEQPEIDLQVEAKKALKKQEKTLKKNEKKKTAIKQSDTIQKAKKQATNSIKNTAKIKPKTEKGLPGRPLVNTTGQIHFPKYKIGEEDDDLPAEEFFDESKTTIVLSDKKKDYFNKQREYIFTYFFGDRKINSYNKYACTCCGKFQPLTEFYINYSYANIGRSDEYGQLHTHICKDCSKKLFFYHYYRCNKDEETAMEKWCCDLNIYWEKKLFLEARKVYDNNPTSNCIVPDYIAAVGRKKLYGNTYWDSPSIRERAEEVQGQDSYIDTGVISNSSIIPLAWDKEEALLKKKVVNLLRYDPFEGYSEEDARKMYYDFDLMIDETMTEDILKLKAAVEIVCSHHKIEKLRQKEILMEQNSNADDKTLKLLTERRMQELTQINKFSQDNGFSARYATKKAKGAGTLTGVMNEMRNKDYEPSLTNYYNVRTCKEMQEVANMSMKAIFDQIGMNDNEAWSLVQKQTQRIMALDNENTDLKEQLRLKEIELKKIQLIYLAKQNQIQLTDDDNAFWREHRAALKEDLEQENLEIDVQLADEEKLGELING